MKSYCRICYSEKDCPIQYKRGSELIKPCKCSGSMNLVHRGCLDEWRIKKSLPYFDKCDICQQPFKYEKED